MENEVMEAHSRIAVLEAWRIWTDKQLFGNGQPGILDTLTKEIAGARGDVRKLIIVVTVIEVVTHLLTGGGSISLKALLELLK